VSNGIEKVSSLLQPNKKKATPPIKNDSTIVNNRTLIEIVVHTVLLGR
jgi:hypothetical protein